MKVFKCLISFMDFKEGGIYMGTQVTDDVWRIYTHDNYPVSFTKDEIKENNPMFECLELI